MSKIDRWRKDDMLHTAYHAGNSAIAKRLGGNIRERQFNLGICALYPLFDHPTFVWKQHRGLAIISHSYIKPANAVYELDEKNVAKRLTVESSWYPGVCQVYVIMPRHAPEWSALEGLLP
jgi:hypothetical protein